jgi:hypothetical protein
MQAATMRHRQSILLDAHQSPFAETHPTHVTDPRPTLQLVTVLCKAPTASGEDEPRSVCDHRKNLGTLGETVRRTDPVGYVPTIWSSQSRPRLSLTVDDAECCETAAAA